MNRKAVVEAHLTFEQVDGSFDYGAASRFEVLLKPIQIVTEEVEALCVIGPQKASIDHGNGAHALRTFVKRYPCRHHVGGDHRSRTCLPAQVESI